MTEGCQSRKDMEKARPYRCFPCKTKVAREAALKHYYEKSQPIVEEVKSDLSELPREIWGDQ